MEIVLLPGAKKDLEFWVRTGNKTILKKIGRLIEAIIHNPYDGIGSPEPLKYSLSGTWSRRINLEHRIVYEIIGGRLLVHSLKGHY